VGIFDLHNHLLPGVDDGAVDVDESLTFLEDFAANGVSVVVFTPHLLVPQLDDGGIDDVLGRHRQTFDGLVAHTGPSIPGILLGQEILARQPSELARVVDRTDIGLGGDDVILVEFGFGREHNAPGVIGVARAAGRTPLIAHAERYLHRGNPIGDVERWRRLGALIQVNGASLRGRYGPTPERRAAELIDEGLVSIVATDHHGRARPDHPATLFATLADRFGHPVADSLMCRNPARLMARPEPGRAGLGAA
jgi:protein-tyrosine phosphatase